MTKKTNPEPPAFPLGDSCCEYGGTNRNAANGMSLRDYFAAKAMLCAMGDGWEFDGKPLPPHVAADFALMAYQMADAMLKARAA